MRILDLIDDNRLKINLDTSNVNPDTVVELTRQVADRVDHLHVKDRRDNDHRIVLGTGEVDLGSIFKILKQAGFDGCCHSRRWVAARKNCERARKTS